MLCGGRILREGGCNKSRENPGIAKIGLTPPPTVVNFWPPCGNSPTVQNAYILVQFVSKID